MVAAEYNRGSSSNNANAMRVSSTTAIVDTSIESIINHRCRSIFRTTDIDRGNGNNTDHQEPTTSSTSSRCSGGGILQCLSSFTLRPIHRESSMDVEELVSDSSDDEHHHHPPMHRQQQQSFQSIFRRPICGTKRGFEDEDDEDDEYLHCNEPSKKRRCIAPSICRSNPIGSTSSIDGYEDTPPPLSTISTSSSSVSPLAWSSSPYTSLFVEAAAVPVMNDDTRSLNHPLSFQISLPSVISDEDMSMTKKEEDCQ